MKEGVNASQRKRESECTVDLLGGKKQALI